MRVFGSFLMVTGMLAMGVAPAEGAPQSPIKFENAVSAVLNVPQFNYNKAALTLKTQNHAATGTLTTDKPAFKKIEGSFASYTPTLKINNETYDFQEMHFHQRQEHVLGLNNYPLELHLVHKHADGRNVAVGLWIDEAPSEATENAALAQIAADLPVGPANVGPDGVATINDFNLPALLPIDRRNFFRYEGSLTTFKTNADNDAGMSSVDVMWYFYKDPLKLTDAKITKLMNHPTMTTARAFFPMNANTHKLHMHVPEPSTVWLLAVAGLFAGRRRRR